MHHVIVISARHLGIGVAVHSIVAYSIRTSLIMLCCVMWVVEAGLEMDVKIMYASYS